jgi:hypothetical protein
MDGFLMSFKQVCHWEAGKVEVEEEPADRFQRVTD